MTLQPMMGLSLTVGHVLGLYDIFYLSKSTPNGRSDSHAMVTQFQVQPGTAQLPGINTLAGPWFTALQYKSVGDTRSIPLYALH